VLRLALPEPHHAGLLPRPIGDVAALYANRPPKATRADKKHAPHPKPTMARSLPAFPAKGTKKGAPPKECPLEGTVG
jgi:hypothetical protein